VCLCVGCIVMRLMQEELAFATDKQAVCRYERHERVPANARTGGRESQHSIHTNNQFVNML
jgi:hypothetical protein